MSGILKLGFGAAALAAAAAAAAQHAPSLCAPAKAAVAELECAEAGFGVALAPTRQRAEQLARLAQAGEARFKRYFGRDPGRYAIFEMGDTGSNARRRSALVAAGYRRALPWLSQAEYARNATAALRTSVENGMKGAGVDDSRRAAAVEQALARFRPQLSPFALDTLEAGVVPHEIGHLWFIDAYWPQAGADPAGHYGGPSPDWLDEISALLMEGADFAENRRLQFQAVYRGRGSGPLASYPASSLIDLPKFLGREHPGRSAQDRAKTAADPDAGMGVRVIAGPDTAREVGLDALIFYLQGRMFADFLVDRTGDPAVFGSIGEAFGKGRTIEQWLAAEGRAKGLAESVSSLDAEWRAWLTARFGPPAPPR